MKSKMVKDGQTLRARAMELARRAMALSTSRFLRRRGLTGMATQCSNPSQEQLDKLRRGPFLHRVLRVLETEELVADLDDSLKVWHGYVDEQLAGEALQHLVDGRSALAFFNWAATQPGYKHSRYTYNCLLSALEAAGCYPIVFDVFSRMVSIGLEPSGFSFDVTFRAVAATGELGKCRSVLAEMKRRRTCPHPSTYEHILLCLCKNGEVEDAYDVFSSVTRWPDPKCFPHRLYNRFIAVLTKTRHLETGFTVFLEMINNGYEPDRETMFRLVMALDQANKPLVAYKVADELVRKFHTHLTGRMGRPGDSLADRYLPRKAVATKRQLWRKEELKKTHPGFSYRGPSVLPRHCW